VALAFYQLRRTPARPEAERASEREQDVRVEMVLERAFL
jgi:hypothetical protein